MVWLIMSPISLIRPANTFQLLNLPTGFPSLWSIIRPAQLTGWVAPILALFLQTWLTGGYLGSLVRINTRQMVSPASFVADALRTFWRLLLWNLLWDALALAVALISTPASAFGSATGSTFGSTAGSFSGNLPGIGVTAALLFLVARYVLFFAPIALVAEQGTTMREALAASVRALLNGFLPMLPYAGLMILATGAALSASAILPRFGLFLVIVVYLAIMTWLWHMVVARYLWFSNWAVPVTDAPK